MSKMEMTEETAKLEAELRAKMKQLGVTDEQVDTILDDAKTKLHQASVDIVRKMSKMR